ncbi:type V CRISPR-associated protein Cas4 [Candidatus Kaiserbacteria bacterium]|nr:type V CRISPR-associated protein Cas4 [Candidatus Kaiserbacteria bacterium]
MEPYIKISNINDFLYCPVSIYLHNLYEGFNTKTYHQTPQIVGRANHAHLDDDTYSTARRFIGGMEVYSERLAVAGRIDLYDADKKHLIERKTRIKEIRDGYRYQLYAQYYCMIEMGYEIDKLFLHSLEDNKRYEIPIPGEAEKTRFEQVLADMRAFDMSAVHGHSCIRCEESIYGALAW